MKSEKNQAAKKTGCLALVFRHCRKYEWCYNLKSNFILSRVTVKVYWWIISSLNIVFQIII
jgi:hypothetical protein